MNLNHDLLASKQNKTKKETSTTDINDVSGIFFVCSFITILPINVASEAITAKNP